MSQSTNLDLDEIALIRKPRPWGWFISGLLVIAGAGIVLGYYVPLRSAHHILATEHEKLGQKAAELNQALVKARADLESEGGKVHTFEREAEETKRAKKKATDAHEMIRDGIETAAKALVQSKVLVVTASEANAVASLPSNVVFPRGAKAVASSLTKTLCSIARTAKAQSFVTLEVTVSVPAPFEAKSFELAGAQLAGLSALLSGACQFPAERLSGNLVPTADAKPEKDGISLRFVATPLEAKPATKPDAG